MREYRFVLRDTSGRLKGLDLARLDYPQPGESLTVFDFPRIDRYVVDALEKRDDWWPHDHFEPVCVVIRQVECLQEAANRDNVVSLNPDAHIVTRLAKIEKIARKVITEQLRLDISHADFEALCQASGFTGEASAFDLLAYRGVPMTVGEKGAEWNASTAFHGFSDDAHVLYVTLPGGRPFVMNSEMLEIAKAHYGGFLGADMALTRAIDVANRLGGPETPDLIAKLSEIFTLIREGIMPVYDAAQELTRLAVQGYRLATPPRAAYQ